MSKTVVITGAGGVLCSAFAKEMAKLGHRVALLDISDEAVRTISQEITEQGGQAIADKANVLDRQSLEAAREKVTGAFGPCEILINGAGGNHPRGTTADETFCAAHLDDPEIRTFFDLDQQDLSFVFDLNFTGTLLTTQVFAREMIQKGGCILNISSMNAFRPLTKIPAYSAAKAVVSNSTQWLAVHFAGCGIRVNAMAPGFFATNQNKSLLYDENGELTARSKKILSHTPMGRFGVPEDLLGTLRWLTDDTASGFVTGVVVPVDGGFSAYSGV